MENPGPIDPHRKSELTSQNASDIVSGGAGKEDESTSAVAKERLANANPKEVEKGPPLAERGIVPVGEMITHAPEQTDVEFLVSIRMKKHFTDREIDKYKEIAANSIPRPLKDASAKEIELYNIARELLVNDDFCRIVLNAEKENESRKLMEYLNNEIFLYKETSFDKCSFEELEKIVKIGGGYKYDNYPECREKIINFFIPKTKDAYDTFWPKDIENLVKDQNPKRVIKLLQGLKSLPTEKSFRLDDIYNKFEIKAAAKLFPHQIQANPISQENFADEELGIKSGGANYCCGSMSVAALVAKMTK